MKRVLALLLTAALLCAAGGCASLFDREYYAVEEYEAPSEPADTEEDAAVGSISNYAALRRAVSRLVAEHAESAQLQFQGYEGSISQDISTACWEVKSSTALGAFAVDYISYDLSRIVSYYQAEIFITYKRSAYQTEAVERIDGMAALSARLESALRAGENYLALRVSVASATAEAVKNAVTRAYYADPLTCPVLPSVEAGLYPETGAERIIEVTLDYGLDSQSLAGRREELSEAVDVLAAQPAALGAEAAEADRAYALFSYLAESCAYDAGAGATAWDALVTETASSEGIAMAFEAGCRAAGIGCRVVSGRLDGEEHAWNIVTMEGAAYHVDVSNLGAGEENVFLVSDESLWGAYWWDTSEYPACQEDFGYFETAFSENASQDLINF